MRCLCGCSSLLLVSCPAPEWGSGWEWVCSGVGFWLGMGLFCSGVWFWLGMGLQCFRCMQGSCGLTENSPSLTSSPSEQTTTLLTSDALFFQLCLCPPLSLCNYSHAFHFPHCISLSLSHFYSLSVPLTCSHFCLHLIHI